MSVFPGVRLAPTNCDMKISVQVSLGRAHRAALTKDGRVVLWDQPGLTGSSIMDATSGSSMMHLLTSTSTSLSSLSSISNVSMGGRGSGDGDSTSMIPKFLEGQAGVTIAQVACGDLFTGMMRAVFNIEKQFR